MTASMLSRWLGWFSLGLGATEILVPNHLARVLGLANRAWLVRAFGAREIGAGLTILVQPEHPLGPVVRAAGDVLDLAVLAPALSFRNRQRGVAGVAFAMVLGVMALDVMCAAGLTIDERRRVDTARRARLRKPRPMVRVSRPARTRRKLA